MKAKSKLNFLVLVTSAIFHIQCGTAIDSPTSSTKVVGGSDASIKDYSFMVGIAYIDKDTPYRLDCGGSQIQPGVIITAAHCFAWPKSVDYIRKLRIGFNIQNRPDIGTSGLTAGPFYYRPGLKIPYSDKKIYLANIIRVETYDEYDDRNPTKDIAVVFYDARTLPVEITRTHISTATISETKDLAKVAATAIGYGAINPKGDIGAHSLQKVELSLMEKSICMTKEESYSKTLGEDTYCYYDKSKSGKDTCSGDSGGPLFLNQSGRKVLFALTSKGPLPCGQTDKPGIYTNVVYHANWIKQKIEKARQDKII